MPSTYKSIAQYCAIEDFFLKLFKNLKFEKFWKKTFEPLKKVGTPTPPSPNLFVLIHLEAITPTLIPSLSCVVWNLVVQFHRDPYT